MGKLDMRAFALSSGIIWSFYLLSLGLLAATMNVGTKFVELLASVYIGYAPTIGGSFIGMLWGFLDGSVCGIAFAWLYNKFSK